MILFNKFHDNNAYPLLQNRLVQCILNGMPNKCALNTIWLVFLLADDTRQLIDIMIHEY